MPGLYEQLDAAGNDLERRAITNNLIDTMRVSPDNIEANTAYYGLCQEVISRLGHDESRVSSDYAGQFPPKMSAALVMTTRRVSGFLQAIHEVPKMESAIEAGPGASALLSVAAATRGAEVVAYEIDERAAECAREVVRLTGYAQQIDIKPGSILTATDLPNHVDAAIAEILGPGLRNEDGPAVIAALNKRATHKIPDAARLYAADSDSVNAYWQEVARVDLTDPNPRVSGRFTSLSSGPTRVWVRADIRAQGKDIVADYGTDALTSPVALSGLVHLPRPGMTVEFAYDIGAMAATPDYVGIAAEH